MWEANFIQTGWPFGDTANNNFLSQGWPLGFDTANNRFIIPFHRLALLDLAQSQELFDSFSRLALLDLAQPQQSLPSNRLALLDLAQPTESHSVDWPFLTWLSHNNSQFFTCSGGFSIPKAFHFLLNHCWGHVVDKCQAPKT